MTDAATPEEREDQQSISKRRAIEDAQRLLHRARHGVLGTISVKFPGWPFGSVVPYAVDHTGDPIILIASIAQHTKNIAADDRVSLLVHDDAPSDEDVQAHGRLTLMGRAIEVGDEDEADARARYLARVPDAAGYFRTHDFSFRRIAVENVRFIGGFGRIFWLTRADIATSRPGDPLAAGAAGIVEHMNDDHADALALYCRAFKGITPDGVQMVGVDAWGFDVECSGPDVRLRFDFDEPVTMTTIRPKVVAMVQEARRVLGTSK